MSTAHQPRLSLLGIVRQRAVFGILRTLKSNAHPTKRSPYFWTPSNSGYARLVRQIDVEIGLPNLMA